MKDKYFILTSTEDGIGIDGPMGAEEVSNRITPDKHGETYYGTGELTFLTDVPDSSKGCWSGVPEYGVILIIKGSIIVPKKKTTVTTWEVE